MDDWLKLWEEHFKNMNEFMTYQLDRYSRFLDQVSRPIPEPEWFCDNDIVFENDQMFLRRFSDGKEGKPVFISPPQAGHHSNIADYADGQSLVQSALRHASGDVYCAEWKSATFERKDETIDDFISAMNECSYIIGDSFNLIGLCQGGWQSTIYASLFPEAVESLVVAGAPIDFHADPDAAIFQMADALPMSFYENLVALGGGNMRGEYIVMGFKMMNFYDRFMGDYVDLYLNIDDEQYLERFRRFRDWYEATQDLPGKFYLQVVEDLFKENRLVKGELEVLDELVDISNINHDLYLVSGSKDDITTDPQLYGMKDYVTSKNIVELEVPAGHIGVFMGSKVLSDYWPKIFSRL